MGCGFGFGTHPQIRSCTHFLVGCGGAGVRIGAPTAASTSGSAVDGSVCRMGPAVSRSPRDSDWSIVSTVGATHGPPEVLPIEVAWLKFSKFAVQYKSTNRFFVDLLPP